MQDFVNKKVVLGICGGIAAYKAAFLVRELTSLGADVQVVMTQAAQQFITPLTLQALSGHAVRSELFDEEAERAMGHIELARWADYLLIAPATANFLAKIAQGLADDLLSTLCLVNESPLIICPAMNRSMWKHPATQQNCKLLQQRGVMIVGPAEGSQACGELGYGRLSETSELINALRLYDVQQLLVGQRVLITAGATQEAIDPVRFLSNHSSGKMGYALAQAAQMAGAEVTLISGPTALTSPNQVNYYQVTSAQEMHQQVMQLLQPRMIFIGTAAVADFTISAPAQEKIKKTDHDNFSLLLSPNPDILADVAASNKAALVVGFAAETQDVIAQAQKKLIAKKVDMIVANQVGRQQGFNQETNEVTVITQHQQTALPSMHKTRIAGQLIAIIAATLHNQAP